MDSHIAMDSSPEQTRKRRPTLVPKSLFLSFTFFLTLFFFSSSQHSFYSNSHSNPSTLPTSYSTTTTPMPLHVQDRVLFPDHVLLTLSSPKALLSSHTYCIYHNFITNSIQSNSILNIFVQPVLSKDRYDKMRSIVRCPLPEKNFNALDLSWHEEEIHGPFRFSVKPTALHNWEELAYEVVLDGNTVFVFVKGLNLRPHKVSNTSLFRCHFGPKNGEFWFTTKAVAAAQEVVRCALPQSIRKYPDKARGISVTVSHRGVAIPTVARIGGYEKTNRNNNTNKNNDNNRYELCACTMVWNQAHAIREWVIYHTWLGIQRWFIYDNNSEDNIDDVVKELEDKGYNISRVIWPWIKSQEAGFSHCSLIAKEECKWVGFFDVDEFFYLKEMQKNALRTLVSNFSNSIAEIRTGCLNFGPSGLKTHPKQGVTVGYTCRLRTPERHKSIVRPDLLHESLLNVVHHFELKEGFRPHNMAQSVVVINHYKYQVWEIFKAKFIRRVATYVVDWKEDVNIGSRDRAPGLGTQAIEPPGWRLKFCEVWDTRLKDFVLSHFADSQTGLLPWERISE
ncbi:hypothetical protein VNO78_27302 [Psophocarpus tetragonolobus]|uniref:Glycosyltransferase family 92 protein n=1 Tax=Psophocarpus tetragonolobus TaxID=3891 RepID=A0AAN9XB63_PSOTE